MDQIDRELTSALSIEPSPEFRARVRARIEREPAPRSWYLQWRVVGVGVAAIAVVMALAFNRSGRTGNTRKASEPAVEESPLTSIAPSPISVPARRTRAAALPRRTPLVHVPEVLVAASEVRGLRQLTALVGEGRMKFMFPDEPAPPVYQDPINDIVIAPIAVAAIDVATNAEGDEP